MEINYLPAFLLVLVRMIPVSVFSPALGGKYLSSRIRLLVPVLLSLIITPSINPDFGSDYLYAFFCNGLTGLVMAIVSGLPFYAIQSTGEWIDINRGETLCSLFLPQVNSKTSPLGRGFVILASALYFSCGFHLIMIKALLNSFDVVPVSGLKAAESMMGSGNSFLGGVENCLIWGNLFFECITSMGLPIIIVLWFSDLMLGVLNRIAPALQVFYLGIPLKMWVGILVLSLSLNFFVFKMHETFDLMLQFVS